MTIESETDRINWLTSDGETITSGVGTLPAFVAESSGETLNAAVDEVDGLLEVVITRAQVTAHSLVTGGSLTIRGASYRVNLLEAEEASASDGFVICYCTPS